jgi:hypothetical protein
VNTFAGQRRIVGRILLYADRDVSKESARSGVLRIYELQSNLPEKQSESSEKDTFVRIRRSRKLTLTTVRDPPR